MYINIYTKTNQIIKNTYNGKTTTELKKFPFSISIQYKV